MEDVRKMVGERENVGQACGEGHEKNMDDRPRESLTVLPELPPQWSPNYNPRSESF